MYELCNCNILEFSISKSSPALIDTYAKVDGVLDPSAPTQNMLTFAMLFQLEPNTFHVINHGQSMRMRCPLQYLTRIRAMKDCENVDLAIQATCDFMLPCGSEELRQVAADKARKAKKKTRGPRSKTKRKYTTCIEAQSTFEEAFSTPSFTIDSCRIERAIKDGHS